MSEKGNAIKRIQAAIISLALATAMTPNELFTVSAASDSSTNTSSDLSVGEIAGTETTVEGNVDSDSLADNDELSKEYIESVFGISDEAATVGNYGETYLSGCDLVLYNMLKEKIQAVANSTKSISTSFTLTDDELAKLGINASGTYTAEDLGVESLGTYSQSGGVVYAEGVEETLRGMTALTFDLNEVLSCLLVDCPYDLYWFDKTVGYGYATSGPTRSFKYDSSSGEIVSIEHSQYSLTFAFTVSSDYQDTSADMPEYTVNGKLATAAQTAAENAQSIVDECADYGDYDKLFAYKDKICELVSYNYEAADDNYTGGYGDPWQLVYAFDGDDTTNIVCEGYSKAFQYLCDLSMFESDDVCCYTVTGSAGGGHMWNIVTMDDGENYHTDITFTDSVGDSAYFLATAEDGSVSEGYTVNGTTYIYDSDVIELYGSDDDSVLSLATSAYTPYTHAYGEWGITTNATCTTEGVETRTCTVCGETETNEIAATGHTVVTVEGKDATCTKNGLTDGERCSVCGKIITAQETISATGHNYGTWVTTKAATCTTAGTETRTCSVCGETETATIAATGHTYGSWTTIEDATCTTTGTKTRTCTVCGSADTATIAKLGHNYSTSWTIDSNRQPTPAPKIKMPRQLGIKFH